MASGPFFARMNSWATGTAVILLAACFASLHANAFDRLDTREMSLSRGNNQGRSWAWKSCNTENHNPPSTPDDEFCVTCGISNFDDVGNMQGLRTDFAMEVPIL